MPPDVATAPDADTLPDGMTVIMPALGMAQETGKLVAWRKEPGEAVAATDILFEVETDKSVMEVEAGHDGFLAALLAEEGEDVPVGLPTAIISADKPASPLQRSVSFSAKAATSETIAPPSADPEPVIAPKQGITEPDGHPGPAANGRILASPKARRLALEQGLDLSRLVAHGLPQPYHVADLETLKSLSEEASPASGATEVASPSATPMQVAARISNQGCAGFIAAMRDDGNIEIDPVLLWLRFASEAFRATHKIEDDPLVVEVRKGTTLDRRFINADQSRLSAPRSDDGDKSPSLVLRDFTASAVTSATTAAAASPVLTIDNGPEGYVITLDYLGTQMTEAEAFNFVTAFADRLANPLAHIA